MEKQYKESEKKLPSNGDVVTDAHKDKILRNLDCAVIEFMHAEMLEDVRHEIQVKGYSDHKIFDTTRGVFTEGGPAFPGAGLFAKSHIQVCVRNPNCILGFFMPRKEMDYISWLEQNKRA